MYATRKGDIVILHDTTSNTTTRFELTSHKHCEMLVQRTNKMVFDLLSLSDRITVNCNTLETN